MATEATLPTPSATRRSTSSSRACAGSSSGPGDDGYDEARSIWNGAHDRRPALIVRCAGVADVMRAVDFARSEDLARRRPRRRALASPASPPSTAASSSTCPG